MIKNYLVKILMEQILFYSITLIEKQFEDCDFSITCVLNYYQSCNPICNLLIFLMLILYTYASTFETKIILEKVYTKTNLYKL